jgi:hypothetical protein
MSACRSFERYWKLLWENALLVNAQTICTLITMEDNQMRRTVRHKLTGLFYQESGDLTPYEEQAANFPTIEAAIRFCQDHGLLDVDLVVKAGKSVAPVKDDALICTMRI